jgi:hypothetical protein
LLSNEGAPCLRTHRGRTANKPEWKTGFKRDLHERYRNTDQWNNAISACVFFTIEADIDDPLDQITIELTLPGEETLSIPSPPISAPSWPANQEKRSRQILRVPAMLNFPRLNAGKIQAKIIHNKGEISVATPWIIDLSATDDQPTSLK